MRRSSVTMSDVARRVGVSRTAVSFVLNNRGREKGLSADLEARVREAARVLGYRPSLPARTLASRRSMVIGVVLPSVSVSYGPFLLQDIERQSQAKGYQLMLAQHSDDDARLTEVIEGLQARRVDGLIIAPMLGMRRLPVYRELLGTRLPVVFVDRDPGGEEINLVTSDGARSIEMAVRHLAGLGHTRIALLDAAPELQESRRREMAYRRIMNDLSLPCAASLLRTAHLHATPAQQRDAVLEDARALLETDRPATAIVAVSSRRAIAMYQAVSSMRLRIPGDVSLVAVTGLQFDGFHRARITSVRFSYEEMGKMAFRILLAAIEDDDSPPVRVYVSPRMVEGDTGAPLGAALPVARPSQRTVAP